MGGGRSNAWFDRRLHTSWTDMQFDTLISKLAGTGVPANVTNQYAEGGAPGNTIRRANLRQALAQARQAGPRLLLVAEAPGYRGACRTGVPFTSERLLLAGIDPPGLFGVERGFRLASDDGQITSEQTATIVWRELRSLNIVAVGWNAYPFHPHRPHNPQSNRTPRMHEIRQGQPFLAEICHLFPGIPILAMGNIADRALTMQGIAHGRVRHPAQGGARLFAEGLRAFLHSNGIG